MGSRTAINMAVTALIFALLSGCGCSGTPPAQKREAARDGGRAEENAGDLARGLEGELLYAPRYLASAQNPAFSPDGNAVLLTIFHAGYNDGPAGLYLLDLESGTASALLDEEDCDSVNLPGASWNAASGRIVFSSDREEREEIWTMDAEGGEPFRVTRHDSSQRYREPSFSPDGKWIVFEVDSGGVGEGRHGSIWKVPSDGGDPVPLGGGPASGCDDRQPNWSPAGDRILFQRRAQGGEDWDVYTMSTDGRELVNVTDAACEDTDASWSPDGRWIVYSSDRGGLPNPELFIVSAQGGAPARLTYAEEHYKGAPSWSPDGEWVVFEFCPEENGESTTVIMRFGVPSASED